MKIILSRKGFDSGYGKVASPILPDGRLITLPIPAARAVHTYGSVSWGGGCLSDLTEPLTDGKVKAKHLVHLDPDLSPESRPRAAGWRPAFGQEKAAQGHLVGQGVGVGDLFLFFGWFRQTEAGPDGVLRYRRGAPDIHALFGWLQVGEIVDVADRLAENRVARPWLAEHPHLNAHGAPGNTIYLATDRLVVEGRDLGVPGGGVFPRYHDGLRLTKAGNTRTVWDLPGWFLPEDGPTLTYHRDAARWTREADGRCSLRSVAKGQEFVLDVTAVPDARLWLTGLLAAAEAVTLEAADV